mmetsp:Transcript_39712/g.39305  ORF Transcript_39712/g.39305 Transcript_39712/m.39305 type:complete len:185 (+) Transcript_39712:30-584(+)
MDPHLSQTSTLTGLGFDSQNQPALKLRKNILETASFSSDARPPQMKKRLHKMKTKQEQDQFEMNNLCAEIDSNPSHNDKDFSNDHYEFKDFAPSSLNSAPTKRRRITEDSQDWNLSQCSHANFSTQSHSDSLAKEHDSPKHEQKLQNEDSPNKTFQNFHQYEEERLRSEADSSADENTTPKKST